MATKYFLWAGFSLNLIIPLVDTVVRPPVPSRVDFFLSLIVTILRSCQIAFLARDATFVRVARRLPFACIRPLYQLPLPLPLFARSQVHPTSSRSPSTPASLLRSHQPRHQHTALTLRRARNYTINATEVVCRLCLCCA